MENLPQLINVLLQERLGIRTINKVLKESENSDLFLSNIAKLFETSKRAFVVYESKVKDILKRSLVSNIELITYFDSRYPSLLKEISDSPLILACRGNLKLLSDEKISVVGTRNLSEYGSKVTKELCKFLSSKNITTISGMAFGVDALVHRNSTKTIAVLPTFPSKATPANNQYIFDEILSKNGLIISENLESTVVAKYMYVARNRIIAGLSPTTVVVEAGEKSGSLITAECALDYNRDVYAVPGNIFSEKSLGCNKLISSNVAKVLTSFEDLFPGNNDSDIKINTESLTETEQRIYYALSDTPQNIDDLFMRTGVSVSMIGYTLVSLELKGLVQKDILNNYLRYK